jgi:hypothetical protein
MRKSRKLLALAAGFAVLAAPMFGVAAEAKTYAHHRYSVHRPIYRHGYRSVWANSNEGWRHRSNARGWDNTCINVPWLSSQFACDAR